MLRQLLGASLQLRIAERLLLEYNRNRIRRLRGLCRKQLHNRLRLQRPSRRVPILQERAPLLPREKLKPPNRNLRRRNRSLQKANIAASKHLNARTIKNIAGVFNYPSKPRLQADRIALLAHARRPIQLAARRRNRPHASAPPR